jgi:diguanylate cyclase (GGDEF)-like protein
VRRDSSDADAGLDVPSSRRHRVVGPTTGVMLVIAALLGIAVCAAELLARHDDQVLPAVTIPWPLLLLLFVAVEVFVLHVQVKREARTISMSEIPLVLGMFFAPPLLVVLLRVVGGVLVYALYRRQAPVKIVFNAALNAAEVGIALVLFHLVLGSRTGIDSRGYLAAYVGAAVASGVAGLAVTVVIYFYEGVLRPRDLLDSLRTGVPVAFLTTTISLIAASCLVLDTGTGWLLGIAAVVVVLAYRAYASLSERHLSLERLYRFSQVVGANPEVEGVMRSVLAQARDLLRAERAELTFLSGDGTGLRVVHDGGDRLIREEVPLAPEDWLWGQVVELGSPLLLQRGSKVAGARNYLASRGMSEAIVAPLRGETGVVGLVTVGDRMGSVRTFDATDVQLLETVANHASVALEHGRLVDRLRHEALHDGLTGLPNRAALESGAADALADMRAQKTTGLALLLMDLDGFKEVNDTLGHLHGDLLLMEVGRRLRATIPDTALVARLGGDEFAVLLPGVSQADEAMSVARTILSVLEEPARVEDVRLEVSGSIGIALAPLHGREVGALLKAADVAMYAAKSGRRGAEVYRRDLDGNDPARLLLATQLRDGLAQDQLRVFAQPLARLSTGNVVGVELLVRWLHPERGLLLPDEFIPVAEKTGLLRAVTATVLGEGIASCARWLQEGRRIGISVNLSPRSLLDPELVPDVKALLDLHSVPAELLTLEITEHGVISELADTMSVLHALRELGVRLSVDDFGTGYSSLSYLSRLPVNEVKIDRHFVTGLERDTQCRAIVRSVVDLGQNLGLQVVAEGVESLRTWEALVEMGCDLAQGYLLSRPMPIGEVALWLDVRGGHAAHGGTGSESPRRLRSVKTR